MARFAQWHLAFRPDTDVALLTGMLHVIVAEGLVDEAFVAARVNGYEAVKAAVAEATPERMAEICGIPADTIREVARAFATLQGLDDPVGHGHQPARARHRQRALPDRAVAAHRPDRPARAPGCIRCAARTTCRAPAMPG